MNQDDTKKEPKKRAIRQAGICPYKAKLVDEILGRKPEEIVKKETPAPSYLSRTSGQSIYKKRT